MIVLLTTNRWKIPEFRRFLARHAQTLIVEQPTESPEIIAGYLATARAVLADESNIFDAAGDLVAPDHVGPARNICRLHAWVKDGAKVVRRSYIREVHGAFDARELRPDDATAFDWDTAFHSSAGPTLEAMDSVGLKNSAREQCLSAFARQWLHHKEVKALRWTEAARGDAAWSIDAGLLIEHPLYQRLAPPLSHALAFAIDHGVFFRGAKSRRDGNYWFPGLNGGLPYVPKGDPIHEGTYMFHDVMHQLMPDLVFDGADTRDHRRIYIAYRMMSEAVSLVLADMVMVDGLVAAHPGYDFAKRKIYPLYQLVRERELAWVLRQVAGFVLRGDPGELPVETDAWRAFSAKYSRFFVADFQWTRMNWQNLVARAAMVLHWIELVGADAFAAQGVWFMSEVVDQVGRGLALPELCARLFDVAMAKRIVPALTYARAPDAARSRTAGFRRWLTGQVALFSRYAPIVEAQDREAERHRARDHVAGARRRLRDIRDQHVGPREQRLIVCVDRRVVASIHGRGASHVLREDVPEARERLDARREPRVARTSNGGRVVDLQNGLLWPIAGSADVPPRRYASTWRAHSRPSAIAHTISDAPRFASPAANTPGIDVA